MGAPLANDDQTIKEVLVAMAESSSLHGISRGVASKHWYQRVLWFLVFLGATGGASYQLWRLFSSYTTYPGNGDSTSYGQSQGKRKKRGTASDILLAKIRYFASKKSQPSPNLVKGYDRNKEEHKTSLKKILRRIKRDHLSYGNSSGNTYASSVSTPGYGNSDYYSSYLQNQQLQDSFVQDEWNKRVTNFRSAFQKNDRDIREDIGHNISDMLLSCAFNGKECYVANFTLFQSLEYGNCYTFESSSYVTKQSGPLLGLRMTLNIETSEYINNYMDASGVRLVIHEPGTLPFPEDEGFTLNPSYETTIGMRMLSIQRASEPHGNCENGEDFMRLFGIRYTIPSCLKLCKQREIMERCFCLPSTAYLNVGNLDGYRPCSVNKMKVDCEKFINYKIENQLITCNCLSPCKQLIYETSLSGRKWPGDQFMGQGVARETSGGRGFMTPYTHLICHYTKTSLGFQILFKAILLVPYPESGKPPGTCFNAGNLMKDLCQKNNMWYFKGMCQSLEWKTATKSDTESLAGNFLKTVIYYEDLNYEKITEEPLYDGFQLISDIGGALGLFMGASILSFVEVLQFIIELLNFLLKKITLQRLFAKNTKVLDFKEEKEYNKENDSQA
ncbi:FMRFamide-activated amiloride-sensitive sodium channel-like [Saccostrea echinata]|uniref:FMRFamide-activated amiloride-sensitive sodium channel-like n=1 Tax=Saccostrea echinata TaxID=191078 RepID=UPI002A81A73A|nr:FMRFamide-activated amiloride-sensitive sodium channel-like [Saccostrea echinata]